MVVISLPVKIISVEIYSFISYIINFMRSISQCLLWRNTVLREKEGLSISEVTKAATPSLSAGHSLQLFSSEDNWLAPAWNFQRQIAVKSSSDFSRASMDCLWHWAFSLLGKFSPSKTCFPSWFLKAPCEKNPINLLTPFITISLPFASFYQRAN